MCKSDCTHKNAYKQATPIACDRGYHTPDSPVPVPFLEAFEETHHEATEQPDSQFLRDMWLDGDTCHPTELPIQELVARRHHHARKLAKHHYKSKKYAHHLAFANLYDVILKLRQATFNGSKNINITISVA